MQNLKHNRIRSQRGAVLIVALVLLLVLTVLGTAGIQDTVMEERMAGNFRDYSAAMQAAETALRAGEMELGSSTAFNSITFGSTAGTYDVTATTPSPNPKTAAYGRTVAANVLEDDGDLLVDAVPEYYLEQLPGFVPLDTELTAGLPVPLTIRYYRITAKGYGISPNSEVILQSTYR